MANDLITKVISQAHKEGAGSISHDNKTTDKSALIFVYPITKDTYRLKVITEDQGASNCIVHEDQDKKETRQIISSVLNWTNEKRSTDSTTADETDADTTPDSGNKAE